MIDALAIFGVGALSSFVGGLMGLGGGFLLVPLLTLQLGYDIKDAIVFSLVCLTWLGLIKMFEHRHLVQANRELVRSLSLMSILGAFLAGLLGSRVPSPQLNLIFGIVLIAVGLYFFKDRHWQAESPEGRPQATALTRGIFFLSGGMGGLLGLGGGIFNIPALHKLLRYPMTEATKLNFPFILI